MAHNLLSTLWQSVKESIPSASHSEETRRPHIIPGVYGFLLKMEGRGVHNPLT